MLSTHFEAKFRFFPCENVPRYVEHELIEVCCLCFRFNASAFGLSISLDFIKNKTKCKLFLSKPRRVKILSSAMARKMLCEIWVNYFGLAIWSKKFIVQSIKQPGNGAFYTLFAIFRRSKIKRFHIQQVGMQHQLKKLDFEDSKKVYSLIKCFQFLLNVYHLPPSCVSHCRKW